MYTDRTRKKLNKCGRRLAADVATEFDSAVTIERILVRGRRARTYDRSLIALIVSPRIADGRSPNRGSLVLESARISTRSRRHDRKYWRELM